MSRSLQVKAFVTPYLQSVTYLVRDGVHSLLVDPCKTLELVHEIKEHECRPDLAILTHEHWDHIMGVDWARELGAEIICSKPCANNIRNPKLNASRYAVEFCALQDELYCTEKIQEFTMQEDRNFCIELSEIWAGHTLMLRETPGHSDGSCCIFIDENVLFSGDTLFKSKPINTRLPGGSRKKYNEVTLPFLLNIDKSTEVYPGHFEPFLYNECTTILKGDE